MTIMNESNTTGNNENTNNPSEIKNVVSSLESPLNSLVYNGSGTDNSDNNSNCPSAESGATTTTDTNMIANLNNPQFRVWAMANKEDFLVLFYKSFFFFLVLRFLFLFSFPCQFCL